jgi:predicted ester cyclase
VWLSAPRDDARAGRPTAIDPTEENHVSTEANLARAVQLQEAWGSHDLDRIASFFHVDFENHQTPFEPVIGLEAYLRHCAEWFEAFPDLRFENVSLFGQGDLVCIENRAVGTRNAGFFGTDSRSREEVFQSCDVLEFRDGKVACQRGYWDFSVTTGELAPRARRS